MAVLFIAIVADVSNRNFGVLKHTEARAFAGPGASEIVRYRSVL